MNFNLAENVSLVHGDYEQITRVVHNLIDNAVKFVNEDGNIEITTQNKGEKMLIAIKNSGSIIPEEKLNKIWSRFSKLDMSRGLKKDSSGLGLSIIKEIIQAHGEQVQVYSNELLGGCVYIFLCLRILLIRRVRKLRFLIKRSRIGFSFREKQEQHKNKEIHEQENFIFMFVDLFVFVLGASSDRSNVNSHCWVLLVFLQHT